jgi:TPR repeat protein
MTESNPYLARAYLAKKSDSQAETVLKACKDTNETCLSDYAFYFQSGDEAMKSLEIAYEKGDPDAAWRIGSLYAKKNQITSALEWYEKGSKSKNAGANISLALYWGGDSIKNYKKALTYAKMAVGGDLSGRPDLLLIDNVPERLIESLYIKDNDFEGAISFFTDCANKKSAFCIETLANTYLVEKDFESAKKWALLGAEINNAKSMWVLSQVEKQRNVLLPKGTSDPSIDAAIFKWYVKAAELGEVKSTMALAFGYAFGIGNMVMV